MKHVPTNKQYAVKIPKKSSYNEEDMTELRNSYTFQHPNFVQIVDAFAPENGFGPIHIVYEYMYFRSLEFMLKSLHDYDAMNAVMPEPVVSQIAYAVRCYAMFYVF